MNDINNIEDDENLKGLKGNKEPFKTSGDYFENFSERLQKSIDGYEEVKDMAPLLSEIPKYNPFEVPTGYFDELPTLVQEKCNATAQSLNPFGWLLVLLKPRIVVPVFSLLLIAFLSILYFGDNGMPQDQLAEENSIEEQLQHIDESMIIEELTADASSEEEVSEEEKIKDYLLDNNIDLNNEL